MPLPADPDLSADTSEHPNRRYRSVINVCASVAVRRQVVFNTLVPSASRWSLWPRAIHHGIFVHRTNYGLNEIIYDICGKFIIG